MKKTIIANISAALYLCLLCSLTGCTKEEVAENASNKSAVLVTVNLNETSWNTEQSVAQTKASVAETTIPVEGGVLTATLEPSADTQTRSTDLNYGVRYRLIAYAENDISAAGYVNHADFVKGGATPFFWLQTGKAYTLVCYSYNTVDALPNFNKSITAIAASPANDFLYCRKNVTITTDNRSFSLELAHLFSKVTVIADVSADGYAISACSGTFAPNYSGTLSLTDGSLTKGSSVSKSINWASFGSATASSTPTQVYTNGEAVTLTLNSITIGGTVITNKSFTFTGNAMALGKSYTLRVVLKKFINDTPITVGSYKWAPANLIYSNGTYSFAATAEYFIGSNSSTKGDLFYWNSLYTTTAPAARATYNSAQDPCRKVSPAGTWRTPTYDEARASLNSTTSITATKNGVKGMYIGTSSVPAAGTENNYLFLPGGTAGTDYTGEYWTSIPITTQYIPDPNFKVTDAYTFRVKPYDSPLGIYEFGINVLNQTNPIFMRCIKN